MDEVIVDALDHHLATFNSRTNAGLTTARIAELGLEHALEPHHQEVFAGLAHEPGFLEDLAVMPGSQATLQLISATLTSTSQAP